MEHAQQAALALYEAGALDVFVTGFAWRRDGFLAKALSQLPFRMARQLEAELERRSIQTIPSSWVRTFPLQDLLRTAAHTGLSHPIATDLLWDWQSQTFDKHIAHNFVRQGGAVQLFEYTALEAFRRAKEMGVLRILHLPSLDSRITEEITRRERAIWPELNGRYDGYFDTRFERRYARRRAEIELADVIIANSSLTARSHIAAGADPSKVYIVPLAAPAPIELGEIDKRDISAPLRVIWAGPFSLRKGAHHMLDAWRRLAAGQAARLDVYGFESLPQRLAASSTDAIFFHGSVPRRRLFEAYRKADVLAFPTLSDGFGMVVTEAFAHGLPVITTDRAGAVDLVSSDNGFVVPAANPQALANAIRWCLDNRSRLADMRKHALATAQRRQWSDFRQELIAALAVGASKAGYKPTYLKRDE